MLSYKRISIVLGAVSVYCFMQAFGLIQPIVEFLNSLPRMIGR